MKNLLDKFKSPVGMLTAQIAILAIIALAILGVNSFTIDKAEPQTNILAETDERILGDLVKEDELKNRDGEVLDSIFTYSLSDSDLEYFKTKSVFDGDYAVFKVSGTCLDFYHTSPEGKEYFMTGCGEDLEAPIPGLMDFLETKQYDNLQVYGEYYSFECGSYKPWCVVDLTIHKVQVGNIICPVMQQAYSQYSNNGELKALVLNENDKNLLIVKRRHDNTEIRRVEEKISSDPKTNLGGFFSPRFSPDGTKLYFMSSAWVTSHAIHELDITSGKTRFITDATEYFVVPAGEYTGMLVVNKHKYFLGSGSYDWYLVIDPKAGMEIGQATIGDNLYNFIDLYVCK